MLQFFWDFLVYLFLALQFKCPASPVCWMRLSRGTLAVGGMLKTNNNLNVFDSFALGCLIFCVL